MPTNLQPLASPNPLDLTAALLRLASLMPTKGQVCPALRYSEHLQQERNTAPPCARQPGLEHRWAPDHCGRRTTDRLNPARVPRETIAPRGDVCTHLPRIYNAFCAQHSASQDGASLARKASSDQGSGTCCAGGVDPNGPSRNLADNYRLRLGWQREYPRSAD